MCVCTQAVEDGTQAGTLKGVAVALVRMAFNDKYGRCFHCC